MLNLLTSIIGVVAKGRAAKAIAGGTAGVILTAGEPMVDAFLKGFAAGGLPQIEQLGVLVGQAVIGFVVGYAMTWLAPKNAGA